MIADVTEHAIELRIASPSSSNFGTSVLGIKRLTDAPPEWMEFLGGAQAKIMVADMRGPKPVMAFLMNDTSCRRRSKVSRKDGDIPAGFQRLIDAHFRQAPADKNEVILNRQSSLIERAMSKGVNSPLASVVRLVVHAALHSAGASLDSARIPCRTTISNRSLRRFGIE